MIAAITRYTKGRCQKASSSCRALFARCVNDQKGVASIEMAFIFPVMLLAYFGLVDITNALSADRRVTLTASTLADLVTQAPGSITEADMNGFFDAASPIMDPFPTGSLTLEVFNFTPDNSGNPTFAWKHTNGGTSCGAQPATNAAMKALMTGGYDVVVSRVCYQYTAVTGQVLGSGTFTLGDQLSLRPRQSAAITCSDC